MKANIPKPLFLNVILIGMFVGAVFADECSLDGRSGFRRLPAEEALKNLFLIGDEIYSGPTPENAEDFQFLTQCGVRTIVSVDGAPPNLEQAKRAGLRYVHIPLKYSEVAQGELELLAAVAEQCEFPIYVHCHHGKHRGPTAAAIISLQKRVLSPDQSIGFLKAAGTGQQYQGLWECVKSYSPVALQSPVDLPEQVEPHGLQESMVEIGKHYERLQKIANEVGTPESSDAIEEHAVAMYQEARESARLGSEDDELRRLLIEFSESSKRLAEVRLTKTQFQAELRLIEQQCISCHRDFR